MIPAKLCCLASGEGRIYIVRVLDRARHGLKCLVQEAGDFT